MTYVPHPSHFAHRKKPFWHSPEKDVGLYQGDVLDVLKKLPSESVDCVWTDPPYNLSNDGITCVAGRMVPVNKGDWDRSRGIEGDFQFNLAWLEHCYRILKPTGSIWVTGTLHVHPSVGMALLHNGFRLLNDIVWEKPNPPPNLGCRTFTHATELVLWASKAQKGDSDRYKFNYEEMKLENGNKQMKSIWKFQTPRKGTDETKFGRHPTQKPVALVDRCLRASTDPGDVVLDPFVGSGTSGVASVAIGRMFMGIDLSETYLQIAKARLSTISSQKTTLYPPPLHNPLYRIRITIQAIQPGRPGVPQDLLLLVFPTLVPRRCGRVDRQEALHKLRELAGQDLRELAQELEVTVFHEESGRLNKGWAGHTVERYLGLPLNCSQSPNLGSWELKVVPLIRKNGSWEVKETMAITMLDEYEVERKHFEDSHLFQKMGKLITVARHWHDKTESRSEVLLCNAFELRNTVLYESVYNDYTQIRTAIQKDIALQSSMGDWIQPRTKGRGHGSRSRAFYARKPLVRHLIGLDQTRSLSLDCVHHAGNHNLSNRKSLDSVMARLPNNQSGKGRHKCPYCAYEAGYQDGLRTLSPENSV